MAERAGQVIEHRPEVVPVLAALGEEDDAPGTNAGEVLEGDAPIAAALSELKKPAVAQKPAPPKG